MLGDNWSSELVLEACAYCFAVVQAHFAGTQERPELPRSITAMPPSGVFVTWTKADGTLRGCIGCLEPICVSRLGEYALKAALHDSRFSPIGPSELSELSCHVSVLHSFEPTKHIYDWCIGTHGVVLEFPGPRSRRYSATYLPEVALEHGMTHQVALRELVRKSGYRGNPTDVLHTCSVTRYQSLKLVLDYTSYLNLQNDMQHMNKYKSDACSKLYRFP